VGRFSKYLGEAEEIDIEYKNGTKETLKLKPLGWGDIKDLLLIGKDIGKNPDNPLEGMNEKTIDLMQDMVLKTMKISYPEEPEDELKAFATKNFMVLMPIIIDMNLNVGSSEKLEKIKELQKRVKDNAGKVSPTKTT
jgi:hypothetical protein